MSGDGFSCFDLPDPLGRVCVGICMGEAASRHLEMELIVDMNPKDFIGRCVSWS